MSTHADKTQAHKSQSANETAPEQHNKTSTYYIADHQPKAIQMRKLQEMMNNSPRMQQFRAIQKMAGNSPGTKQLQATQQMADNAPKTQRLLQLQSKMQAHSMQKAAQLMTPEEEEEKSLQGQFEAIQRITTGEDEEEQPLQGKFEAIQRKTKSDEKFVNNSQEGSGADGLTANNRLTHPLDSDNYEPVTQRQIAIDRDTGEGVHGPDKIREFLDLIQPVYDTYYSAETVKRGILDLIKSHNIYRFQSAMDIFRYMTEDEEDRTIFTEELQIHPDDMKVTGPMPKSYSVGKGCVVQAIAQMVGNTPQHWHDYFIETKRIDYTEAMNHLKVFSDEEVGLSLIHNENTTWGALNGTLSNGKYVFIKMDRPGIEGHAFAVTKNGDGDYTIHDEPQQIIKRYNQALRIQYVFE